MDKVIVLFDQITDLIINYEDGDVLTLSTISDICSELKSMTGDEEIIKILEQAIILVNNALKNSGPDNFQDLITKDIDKIQRLLQKKSAVVELKTMADDRNNDKEVIKSGLSLVSDELVKNFIVEAEDRIVKAQELILELEKDTGNKELINGLFRIFHTIKGECGFLKIATLGELTHNIENILDMVRSDKLQLNPELIDILLEGVDLSKDIVRELKNGEVAIFNKTSLSGYISTLNEIKSDTKPNLGTVLINKGKVSEEDVEKILEQQKVSAFSKKFGEVAVENHYITERELQDSLKNQRDLTGKDLTVKDEPQKKSEKNDQIIKVKASKVNYLVDMIGELLIAVGQISDSSPGMLQARKIIKILQYAGMQLRTESVKNLFGNVKRVIRDVSKKLNKVVNIETIGDDLEVDRNLIEKLEEPLIHLVRNSVHHGIETAEHRNAKGKPSEGRIIIGAERRGNNIIISIEDDGQGLNRDKIIAKALERNLIKADEINSLNDSQIYNLIFYSGFSTAEQVDLVSGRGVGMDIVKSVVTANKGKIEIQTEKDKFSKFILIFPLSTAIIDGMVIRLEDSTFIVPIASIIESIKIKNESVHNVNGVFVYKLRDEILPVIDLKAVFKVKANSGFNNIGIVVESSLGKKFVVLVDEIICKKEVVIKSLGRKFKDLKGVSSGTVLAGGKVGLVLDVDQIIEISEKSC